MLREETKVIRIGNVAIGGQNPVAIQSMCNTKTENVRATVDQTVIVTFADERDKVVDCIWCNLRIKLCFDDIAVFHCYSYDRVLCHDITLLI